MDEKIRGLSGKENWNAIAGFISSTDLLQLGSYYSYMIRSDMKHLAFTLSRYKFASKLLMYRKEINILELGCQEALGALLLKQNVNMTQYVGIDQDEKAIVWNKKYLPDNFKFICSDFFECDEIGKENFDAIISLDVIEHIPGEMENRFCEILSTSLATDGVVIVGTPNIMLSPYASEGSKMGHINLYDQKRLYELMNKYFGNVFIFNMNDEVVHTGYAPMSCYIFAVSCNKRKKI